MGYSRRDAANLLAWRQSVPTTQAGLDNFWASITAGLNASLPASGTPAARHASPSARSGKPAGATVDWTAIAAGLNAEAGLRAPARNGAP